MTTIQQFDASVNLLKAILWQYDGAERLQSLLRSKQDWYDENQRDFWNAWYDNVFNPQTANDFGCGVWGHILGVPLSIGQPGTGARPVWGFGNFNRNFGRGNFGRLSSGVSALTTEQKRLLLRLRYYQLISDGSVPYINFTLREVFGAGQGYVLDNLDMTITYVFPTQLPTAVRTMIEQNDLLPRPAGVGISTLVLSRKTFGFGPFNKNFNKGTFGA